MLTGKKPQNLYLSTPIDLDTLSPDDNSTVYAEKTPTIQELQKYIDRIAPDWEKFAVALELDEDGHKIETIRRDNGGQGVQI